ncbi:MAG: hypothetical protein WAN12_14180 [Candidatus Acidiferrum sp.]
MLGRCHYNLRRSIVHDALCFPSSGFNHTRSNLKYRRTPGFTYTTHFPSFVTRQVAPALRRLVEAVPNPKLTFAIGSCATGGGCWFDTYNVLGGADNVIPVDYYIPGCPPRPEAILYGVAFALGLVSKKVAEERLSQETLEELAHGKSIVTEKSLRTVP